MKFFVLILSAGLCIAGCSRHGKEISSLERKQGANFVSEADFAMTMRDFAKAEDLMTKATASCPDDGGYWLALGRVRMLLNRRGPAKDAYERALGAFEDAYAAKPKDPAPLFHQIDALVLLGRTDKARAVLAEAQKKHADDPDVRRYVSGKVLERLLTDPELRRFAL